jgi:hypothetical protein
VRPNLNQKLVRALELTALTNVPPAVLGNSQDPKAMIPVIAVVASTPRGKSTLIIDAMKIAAIGRAMTK